MLMAYVKKRFRSFPYKDDRTAKSILTVNLIQDSMMDEKNPIWVLVRTWGLEKFTRELRKNNKTRQVNQKSYGNVGLA